MKKHVTTKIIISKLNINDFVELYMRPSIQLCEATIPCDAAWLAETLQYCILVHVKHLLWCTYLWSCFEEKGHFYIELFWD